MVALAVILSAAQVNAQGANTQPQPAPNQSVTDAEFHLPLDDETAAEVDRLIPLLSSPEFTRREQATTRLTEIGAPAFARLRVAYHRSDDLEVLLRIERIVREGYMTRHVFARFGFLGIRRKRGPGPTHGDDPRIREGHTGIVIGTVLEDTAAARAGLQPDDVIIAADGSHFHGDAILAFQSFAKGIREGGAGARVSFTVLRSDDTKQIDAILGPAPREGINQVAGLEELYVAAGKRLEIWWYRHFRNPPTASPND
ncbi:MAG: PDZ domain-containing protein [Planctomycetota bacterium]|jgi:hypothetical protein